MLSWTLTAVGYLVPAVICAFPLRPAGDVMSAWGRSATGAG